MEKEKIGLNTRQKLLLDFLLKQKGYRNLKDVALESNLYGEIPLVDTNNCVWIRILKRDIQKLRKSGKVETSIISNTRGGIKVATKEEYVVYSNNRRSSLKRALNLLSIQDKKAGLDGQYSYDENEGFKIIESYTQMSI